MHRKRFRNSSQNKSPHLSVSKKVSPCDFIQVMTKLFYFSNHFICAFIERSLRNKFILKFQSIFNVHGLNFIHLHIAVKSSLQFNLTFNMSRQGRKFQKKIMAIIEKKTSSLVFAEVFKSQ